MQKRVSQVGGDYCFNLINTLIDYKGDVLRNSKRSDGQIVYSPDFSPNNIRRLILSADGARIDFHVSVDGRLSRLKVFSDADKVNLCNCILMPDYKPMVWALADRVCSSIEEIIICTNNSTGVNLTNELNVSGLLRKGVSSTGDIKTEVSKRYKRLAYFTIVNCDIDTLLKNNEVVSCNNSLKMISETDFVKSCGDLTRFKSDWFNYWGTTSAYSLDMKGSKLNEHFKKIRQDVEDLKKKNSINKIKSDRLKGVMEKYNKAMINYTGVYTCISKLNVILRTEGKNYMCYGIEDSVKVGSFRSPDTIKQEFDALKSDYEAFIKDITGASTSMYTSLASWFFNSLTHLKSLYPLTLTITLDDIERSIAVPPSCSNLVQTLGEDFKGVLLPDSTSNICCYTCKFFVTNLGLHNMKKYHNKDIWMKEFKGGAE